MIAIYEAYRTGLLGFKNWLPNLVAGLIVGVVALPLAMAFAIASSFLKRIPALVIATLMQTIFQFKGISTLGSAFGTISSALPSFQLPNLSIPLISQLIGPAFTIALLCIR